MSHGLPRHWLAILLVAVTLAHGAVLWFWKGLPELRPAPPALEVGFTRTADPIPASHHRTPQTRTTAPVPDRPDPDTPPPLRDNHPLTQAENTLEMGTQPAAPNKPATHTPGLTQPQAPNATIISQSPPRYQAAHLNNAPAEYPPLARRRGWEGKVVLKVWVLAAGTAGEIRVQTSSGYAALDLAAEDAVRRWRFIAAKRGDTAIDDWVLVPVEFRLTDD